MLLILLSILAILILLRAIDDYYQSFVLPYDYYENHYYYFRRKTEIINSIILILLSILAILITYKLVRFIFVRLIDLFSNIFIFLRKSNDEEKLRQQITTLENELQEARDELGYKKVDSLTRLNEIIDNKTRVWIRSKEFKRYLGSSSDNSGDLIFQRHQESRGEELFIERRGIGFIIRTKNGTSLHLSARSLLMYWQYHTIRCSRDQWQLHHLGGSGWAIFRPTGPFREHLSDNNNGIAEAVYTLGSCEKFEIIY